MSTLLPPITHTFPTPSPSGQRKWNLTMQAGTPRFLLVPSLVCASSDCSLSDCASLTCAYRKYSIISSTSSGLSIAQRQRSFSDGTAAAARSSSCGRTSHTHSVPSSPLVSSLRPSYDTAMASTFPGWAIRPMVFAGSPSMGQAMRPTTRSAVE
eukprot:365274-Chlamydomonas_euryale.AAC.6